MLSISGFPFLIRLSLVSYTLFHPDLAANVSDGLREAQMQVDSLSRGLDLLSQNYQEYSESRFLLCALGKKG